MVSTEQLTAKDLQTYKEELLRFNEFNELNESLYDFYNKSSLFNKIQYRSGARIMKYEGEPFMLIWSETRNYNVKVRSIIPFRQFSRLEQVPLGDVMHQFKESLPQHLEIHQFEYLAVRNEMNDDLLEKMGYKMR